jgi:hypothetical protein
MRKRVLTLLLIVAVTMPFVLFPQSVEASYYTFHQIEPEAQVTISTNDVWLAINATTYGVPVGATGIIYRISNWEGSGGKDCSFGVRKHGSTDNRTNPLWEHTPSWGAIGVDGNATFDIYKGSQTANFGFWIIGYTTSGVTFFTNGFDKTPASFSSWQDIDCSAEAPNAIGLIFEVVGPARGDIMTNFGFRKNGSTDSFVYNAADHLAPGVMIGCDASQICEGWAAWNYKFYLIGYITDGAYFYTNGVYQGPDTPSAWTDLPTALPANSVMGFYEFRGSGSAYGHDLRKNGSSWSYGGLDNRHCWAFANCDGSGLVEGYVASVTIDYYLVGYACPGFYSVATDAVTDVDYDSANLHGTIIDDGGEDIEFRGFQWGLTKTATWSWYEGSSTEVVYTYTSDNYLDGSTKRRAQHVNLTDTTLTSMSFYLCKINSPNGNVTFSVRNVTGDTVLWSEVWGDASTLTTGFTWYQIVFDSPVYVNDDVRLCVEYYNGNSTDKVNTGYYGSNVGPGAYCSYASFSWSSDTSTREMNMKYTYESSGHYSEGAYSHTITGLDDDESYWYRAYMVSNVTTYYGLWYPFITSNLPHVDTLDASSIGMTTARLNSVVTSDGDVDVTIRFGWGTTNQSAIEDYDDWGTVSGTFNKGEYAYLDITGLNSSTLYYFRVEGTNLYGSGLGDELTFNTTELIGAVQNFRAIPAYDSISLVWDAEEGASQYYVIWKSGSYPTGILDGTLVYFGVSTSTIHIGLPSGKTYYYGLWGESGGSYSPDIATVMATTTVSGTGATTIEPPSTPSRWLSAPDYTNLAGLLFIYDAVNGSADALQMPRATLWMILAIIISLVLAIGVYIVSRYSILAAGITLIAAFGFGWLVQLIPFWIPLFAIILVVGYGIAHREVQY